LAKRCAQAKPMAPVPPVMTATLPVKESVGSKLEVMDLLLF
jgi:hypothetical protein